ncbi:heparinase II/III family protein [Paenibacillus sp. N3/727]|uniref:alginate lyase family protein n=1 Tax=Paenibacillus sp. N3/727 TaxID=2925845 RepID=UPI001F5351B6|nr:alginate lyase family protein [Paenibacillus sp. N3/727]UNK19164.1 heparinase II/III family protein [Paenibacillus sp. N3/727]
MNAEGIQAAPYAVFTLLDLTEPGLASVRKAVCQNRYEEALIELHQHFIQRGTPGWALEEEEKGQIADYVKHNCGSDLETVMKTADEVVRQTFLFRFPWDMERSRIPVTFEGEIDWGFIPDHDVEWAYMLNRHRYWQALGQAFALTGDEKYAAALCRQLEDWINRNPVPDRPVNDNLTWRTIEAGLRCANWIKALRYVKDSPLLTPLLLAKVLISLHEHGHYLASSFTSWKKISNWGVLETCGLYHVAMFIPEFSHADDWKRLCEQRLKETARIQIMADGIHWEQSPTYHHEVLACYLDCIYAARINGIELDDDFRRTVHQMATASLYWAKPNHRQPLLGDSDDSDIRSLLTYAAWLFQDSILRFGGHQRMDYDNAWLFGGEGIRNYDRLRAELPANLSYPFAHSGHYVMRTGWEPRDLYLYFHCGPLGGGHGHADLLHFDLHAYGRDLLTDLGRYNYSDHTPLRKKLKESASHNTTIVDGIGFTEIVSTWDFGRIAKPSGCRWISKPGYDYVEGGHDGYLHLDDPVYPLRRIIFIKPYYWLLVDSFTCKESHTFTQRFHFAPGEVELDVDSLICRTLNGREANLCIIPVDREGLEGRINEGVISREYNLIEPNQYAVYSRTGKGTISMMQVLYPQRPGETACPVVEKVPVFRHTGEQVDDAQATACKIVIPGTDEEHTLVISHKVPSGHFDSYIVDGIQIFGEVVLIAGTKCKKEVDVII